MRGSGHRQPASPPPTGVGLRSPHLAAAVAGRSGAAWFEVHPENYMGGGPAVAALLRLRADMPIALHGVGLSLGSAGALDRRHLARLKSLVLRLEPFEVSEHLSWSSDSGTYLNDLLPLPMTEEALATVAFHVDEVQAALGRRILIENPSRYLGWRHSAMPESEFLCELVRRTGCGLLCDVNNLFVTEHNCGDAALAWLDRVPPQAIGEIHLAGHSHNAADGVEVLIDDHGSPVAEPVWRLYAEAARRFPEAPALVEWDSNIPDFPVLLNEARTADRVRAVLCNGVDSDARVA